MKTRAIQIHQAGHVLPADSVFKTPGLNTNYCCHETVLTLIMLCIVEEFGISLSSEKLRYNTSMEVDRKMQKKHFCISRNFLFDKVGIINLLPEPIL